MAIEFADVFFSMASILTGLTEMAVRSEQWKSFSPAGLEILRGRHGRSTEPCVYCRLFVLLYHAELS